MSARHLIMFVLLSAPVWVFSLFVKLNLIGKTETSTWILVQIQTIPLVSWWVYTSLVPSIIGEIRCSLGTNKEDVSETVPTAVTTRASFLAIAVAGIALIGLEVLKAPTATSLYLLSMSLFILAFVAFVVSTDISDSAKNVPFRTSTRGVILTRRSARYYQYGLTYMICAFALAMVKVGEIFGIIFIFLWDVLYLVANWPTEYSASYIARRCGGLLVSATLALLPIYGLLCPSLPLDEWRAITTYALVFILVMLGMLGSLWNRKK